MILRALIEYSVCFLYIKFFSQNLASGRVTPKYFAVDFAFIVMFWNDKAFSRAIKQEDDELRVVRI